ncbi:MAG: molybdopterin cofactor-binding domain-containing protein [Anaerolineae bacterium]
MMDVHVTINGAAKTLDVAPGERLLTALRAAGCKGVKHGCETGECGACAVLLDGEPALTCVRLAASAEGANIVTIEAIGEMPEPGWRASKGLDPIQTAFVDTGAIQCGYCTPAMVLVTRRLLATNPRPTEAEARDALSGVLCRCTGYKKPIEAVLRAAAILRGEPVAPIKGGPPPGREEALDSDRRPPQALGPTPRSRSGETETVAPPRPLVALTPSPVAPQAPPPLKVVGKPERKVDAQKLVQGKPAFADDVEMRGMLSAKVLWSPVAHAWIKRIDVTRARALPGVHAVLTYQDLPRVVYSTAGQSDPIPGPLDAFSLDRKVRFVGDRVAFVAAETEAIAEAALELIEVEYEELPAILDSRQAMSPDAPLIHDEPEYVNFAESDPSRNLAAQIHIDIGDVDAGFALADRIFEAEYRVPKVQQVSIEPHIVVTYWDEDDRLVIRTSTQVPFHVRRILAPVLNLPPKRIRVVKPRIGGGFGGKQEVLIEDVAAHLTIATGRPVRFEYTRAEEFASARSRHPMIVRMKTGVLNDGTIVANEMKALSDTGAYGCHALTVTGNTGHKAMALYPSYWLNDGDLAPDGRPQPHVRFHADIVYTNTPPSGAFRGYGVPQGFFPLDSHLEDIARALNLEPLAFRLKNALKPGDEHPFSRAWSEGREPRPETIRTCALEQCAWRGATLVDWAKKAGNAEWRKVKGAPHLRRGIGVALVMQGTAIPYLDMGAASIKLNDDGSFNVLVGATDLGTGSDTVLAQMAAEVLGVGLDDIIMYSSDTDFTPFDKGAYASSTTYISGTATVRAAEKCAEQIRAVAAAMLNERYAQVETPGSMTAEGGRTAAPETPTYEIAGTPYDGPRLVRPADIDLRNCRAYAPDGRSVSLAEVALNSLHHANQHQIMGVASYVSPESPPPFAAQFAEVTVDTETGQVTVDNLVMVVDAGRIINPLTAEGQIEGGQAQALGYGVCEEMPYDEAGRTLVTRLDDYRVFRADEIPPITAEFVETDEPSHPFGVKAVAEIPMDGVAPAVANAIRDAVGARVFEIPATPERVWRVMREQAPPS